jgi:hypothetical protein
VNIGGTRTRQVLKAIWAAGMVYALVLMSSSYSRIEGNNADIFGAYVLLVLGFPSFLVVAALAPLAYAYVNVGNSAAPLALMWVVAVAAGYWQWFVLVPWAIRR